MTDVDLDDALRTLSGSLLEERERNAELADELARERRWRNLHDDSPPEAKKRYWELATQSDALQPIVREWRKKVQQLEANALVALLRDSRQCDDCGVTTSVATINAVPAFCGTCGERFKEG